MINKTKVSIEAAKAVLKDLLLINYYSVPCKYKQSGRVINGHIINYTDGAGNDLYEQIRPDVRVRSNTGKEYFVLITSIISVDSLGEL